MQRPTAIADLLPLVPGAIVIRVQPAPTIAVVAPGAAVCEQVPMMCSIGVAAQRVLIQHHVPATMPATDRAQLGVARPM